MLPLFDQIRIMSQLTDSVIVGFSGGKDSVVTLDLCVKYFKHVFPYFMYIVKGLDFQERIIKYYENKYDLEILRLPHFMLSEYYRYGSFRQYDLDVKIVKPSEAHDYIRYLSGYTWIAGGERISDSIFRRSMIREHSSIHWGAYRLYPVAFWNKSHIIAYTKQFNLPIGLEYKVLGCSFSGLYYKELVKIKQEWPEDFEKIKSNFPLIEAEMKWGELHGNS